MNITSGITVNGVTLYFSDTFRYPIIAVKNEAEFLAAFTTIASNTLCINGADIVIYSGITLTANTPSLNHNKVTVRGAGGSISFNSYAINVMGGNCNYKDMIFIGMAAFGVTNQPQYTFFKVAVDTTSLIFDNCIWLNVVGGNGTTIFNPIIEFLGDAWNYGIGVTMHNNTIANANNSSTPRYTQNFGIKISGDRNVFYLIVTGLRGDPGSWVDTERDVNESRKIYIYGTPPSYAYPQFGTLAQYDVYIDTDNTCFVTVDPAWTTSATLPQHSGKTYYNDLVNYSFVTNKTGSTMSNSDFIVFSDTSNNSYLRKGSMTDVVLNTTDTYTSTANVYQIVTLSAAEYSGIGSPDANTMYVII
jgi:hypothetical protein